MKWNIDEALKSSHNNCFLNNISVGKEVEDTLEKYKETVRFEISETFKKLSERLSNKRYNKIFSSAEFNMFENLEDDFEELCDLINQLDERDRNELLSVRPRFMTQGSMYYKTLNKPAHTPPQQIDIDDGVYIPLDIIEDRPKLGHRILLLIIKAALLNVEKETGWKYKQGKMCATLEINSRTHLDVPMYAVPKDKFLEKEKVHRNKMVSLNSIVANESYVKDSAEIEDIYLEPDNVYLAVTTEEHWKKSDPAVVCKWFEKAISRHGNQLRRVCKYLKAWRDYNFIENGISSIALMACAVEVFDNYEGQFDNKKDTKPLLECAKGLFLMLNSGIGSPDPSDEEKLFPRQKMDSDYINNIRTKAKDFEIKMKYVFENNLEFYQVKSELLNLFGDRLILTSDNLKLCVEDIVNDTPAIPQKDIDMPENSISG